MPMKIKIKINKNERFMDDGLKMNFVVERAILDEFCSYKSNFRHWLYYKNSG